MGEFKFKGQLPASKSMMNRALLIQSYFPELKIEGSSDCDDVLHMQGALRTLLNHLKNDSKNDLTIECGEAGTVLRFMALRAAREVGTFHLRGSRRLFERPQQELLYILSQLGANAELTADSLTIHSEGWKRPMTHLAVHRQTSSQFATSLLLNSWKLPWPLKFEIPGAGVSEGYWIMSLKIAQQVGLRLTKKDSGFFMDSNQSATCDKIITELDLSSAFALSAAAVLAGEAVIENMTSPSLQPDHAYLDIFKKMGIPFKLSGAKFEVRKCLQFNAVQADVSSTPDLVPVLSVLCAFAKGRSVISGVENLENKESNRLKKTIELLSLAGIKVWEERNQLHIDGCEGQFEPKPFCFNPDQDHRMAMAAGLLMKKGFAIKLSDPGVVKKSYVQFWKDIGFRV
jgi:3-phosphoshikimate 1-carboxyvinyltransferase